MSWKSNLPADLAACVDRFTGIPLTDRDRYIDGFAVCPLGPGAQPRRSTVELRASPASFRWDHPERMSCPL